MRLIFSVLTAIVIIAAAIFFVGPLFISTDDLRNQLFAQVEAATGYRLRVSGPIQVTMFPSLELVAEDVGIAQPAAGGTAEFATAKTLRFGLMLRGLLEGKVRMTEVTLIDPVIALPKAKAKIPGDAAAGDAAGGAGDAGPGGKSVAETLKGLSLDKLVIKNGTLILPASGRSPGKRIKGLNLEASLPAFDDTLSFDMGAAVDGKKMHAAGSIGNFGRFLEGAAAPVSLAVEAPAYLEKKATLVATATYKNGTIALSQFTATSGNDSFAGNAIYKGNTVTLNPIRANVRGNLLAGWASVDLSKKIPSVVASLTGKTLNLNTLTGQPGAPKTAADGGGSGDGAGAGWSNAKIDFSPLKAVNAKIALSAEQLIYGQIKISPAALQVTLSGGKLTAALTDFKLYNGAGKVVLIVDARGKTPAQMVQLSLANFDAYPFLKDAAGFQSIEGKGAITLDLTASGVRQRAIGLALNGTAKLEHTNGAIRGINIAKTMRMLGTGIVSGWQGGEAEKTDFASLGANFKVAQGQAKTDDLHFAGPLVRMTGAGTVDLPTRQLNFRVEPQLVATLEGQGGNKDVQGLGMPVIVVGPWARPKIYPDIKGILENPVAAYERLKQFGGGLVKLPGVDNLGDTGSLPAIIEDGKINKDALKQGVIEGIGGLLNKQQPPAGPAEKQGNAGNPPALIEDGKINKDALKQGLGEILGNQQPGEEAPAEQKTKEKSGKDKGAKAAKKDKKNKKQAEEATKQLLQNLFGN